MNGNSGTAYSEAEHTVRVRGFAVIVHHSDYLDLTARHPDLYRGDYGTYLADLHYRMTAARQIGRQVLIGPFLPDQYESYADAIGEPAGLPETVRSYDDFVARVGPHTRPWEGEPMGRVVAQLRASTDTRADQERLLPLLRQAADLHAEPQRAATRALDTATAIFAPLLRQAEPGHHTLTCIVQFPGERVSYVLPVVRTKELVAFPDDGPEQLMWAAMATAQLAERPATLVLRTRPLAPHRIAAAGSARSPDGRPVPLTVRMWRLASGRAVALTSGEAFAIACTDPVDGQPIPPEPGADYVDAFPIDDDLM